MIRLRDFKTTTERRQALEKDLTVSLNHTGQYSLDEQVASTRHCENMIGATQVPLGIAGPLAIQTINNKQSTINNYYIPLATTEGALVASVSRGCKAITESGGAVVDSYRAGATRGPVFRVENLAESDRLNRFLEDHFEELQTIAASTSHHLTLKKYMDRGVGKYRYVRFVFDTQDAMGLNMVTIATGAMTAYIKEKIGISCLALSGNYCVDKKSSWLNMIEGRGIKAWAEVTIPAAVLRNTLKTTAQKVYDVWMAKCMMGSIMSGSLGYNAQFANVIAAIFLATGQDLGHIGECSSGITTMEIIPMHNEDQEESLYVSVSLPDLMVGTVGGGTGLATQKEALTLLGVAGSSPVGEEGNNAQRFAHIIAGAVLAGEVSLLSSLEEGTLVCAHQTLARGKTTK